MSKNEQNFDTFLALETKEGKLYSKLTDVSIFSKCGIIVQYEHD